jgi:predicted phage-related endonuclease
MTETTTRPSMEAVQQAVAVLPQVAAGHVSKATIDRWVASVMRTDPTRILWHIARAAGIGGSDMGSVLGVKHAYSSPGEVYGQKMLLIPPYRATAAMLRGAKIEAPLRALFEGPEESPIELESDEQRKERLAPLITSTFESEIARNNPGVPWMARPDIEALFSAPYDPSTGAPTWLVGNTDRIYQIGDGINILDFKAPSTDTLKKMLKDPAYFEKWDVQVMHYALKGRYLGFEASSLDLAVFDYQNYGSRPFFMRRSEPSDEWFQKILDGGEFFWQDCVMRGVNPEEHTLVQVLAPTPVPPEIEMAAMKAAHLAAIEKASQDLGNLAKETIEAWLTEHPENVGQQLGSMELAAKNKLYKTSSSREIVPEIALTRLADLGLITEDQFDAFRDPARPVPASDPRFAEAVGEGLSVLRAVLDDLRTQTEPVSAAAVADLIEPLLMAFHPVEPGPYNVGMIRDTILLAQQPIAPFESVSVSLRRNTTKEQKAIFAAIKDEAQATITQYVDELLTPVQTPATEVEQPGVVVSDNQSGAELNLPAADSATSAAARTGRRTALITAEADDVVLS